MLRTRLRERTLITTLPLLFLPKVNIWENSEMSFSMTDDFSIIVFVIYSSIHLHYIIQHLLLHYIYFGVLLGYEILLGRLCKMSLKTTLWSRFLFFLSLSPQVSALDWSSLKLFLLSSNLRYTLPHLLSHYIYPSECRAEAFAWSDRANRYLKI